MSKDYSREAAAAIHRFLKDDDWHFSFDEDEGTFKFGLNIESKLRKIDYLIRVHDTHYNVYAVSPLNAEKKDKDCMARMAEFLHRANYGLNVGNFEFDFRDGEIRYKVSILLEDIVLSEAVVKRSIYCPAVLFERYGNGIAKIIFSDASAKEVIQECEDDAGGSAPQEQTANTESGSFDDLFGSMDDSDDED